MDDQVFSARALAEAFMQLFLCVNGLARLLSNDCRNVAEGLQQRLQKRCRRVFLQRVNGFLQDFGKLSAILK